MDFWILDLGNLCPSTCIARALALVLIKFYTTTLACLILNVIDGGKLNREEDVIH
jgi:hypothetical protein